MPKLNGAKCEDEEARALTGHSPLVDGFRFRQVSKATYNSLEKAMSEDAAAPRRRKSTRQEQYGRVDPRGKDIPGLYRVVALGGVVVERKDPHSLGAEAMGTLEFGDLFTVVEVTHSPEARRVLGRLEVPVAGWIPLLDVDTGFSWADKISMKEQVKLNLQKPVYNVQNFYWDTGIWQFVGRHWIFENVTLGVISCNALWIAIDTDNNDATSVLQAKPLFQLAEHCFCVYFSFEWFTRFMAFKKKRNALRDFWFVFDSVLVFMMVLETWILTTVALIFGGASLSAGGQASLLRLLRLLRLSRLARMLRSMPELMILIKGIVAACRSVFFTIVLLVLLMYIFAIMFRQLTADTDLGAKYFRTIPASMYTLLVTGTLLDDLTTVASDIGQESFIYASIFFLFVLLGALTVMNMLIGILCEVVSSVAKEEKETMLLEFVRTKMEAIMMQLDDNGDDLISKDEFRTIMSKPEAVRILEETGVDAVTLVDYIDFIFQGEDGEDVLLSLQDLISIVLKFRNSNVATVKDAVDLRKFVGNSFKRLDDKLRSRGAQCGGSSPSSGGGPKKRNPVFRGDPVAELRAACEGLQRLDAFLTAASCELGKLELELAPLRPDLLVPGAHKLREGSKSPRDPTLLAAGGDSSPKGYQALRARLQRLERFGALGLDELQHVDAVLPISFPVCANGASDGHQARRVRVWRANMEEFLLTVWFDGQASLSKAVGSREPGELQRSARALAEGLEARLGELHHLCDAVTPAAAGVGATTS